VVHRRFRTTVLAGAVLLAISGHSAHAQTAQQLRKELEALREQVQLLADRARPAATAVDPKEVAELREQVKELKEQLKVQAAAAPNTPAATLAANADQATVNAGTSASQADIQGLRTDLENYKYEQSRTAERNRAQTTRNTKIAGTVQLRAGWQNPKQNAGVANGATGGNTNYQAEPRQSSFDVNSVSLAFTGNLYKDYAEGKNLTYALGFAYAGNQGGSPSSATSATRTVGVASPNGSQFNLTNANLSYSFFPTNGGAEDAKGALAFGQQLVPFGLEAQADEEVRPVINSAQFTSALNGINQRQIGLIYRGDAFVQVDYTNNYRQALLEYAFGVVNGSGPNKSDNNNKKDWSGRVAYTLPADYNSWLRQIKVGASYYRGYNNIVNTTSNAVVKLSNSRVKGFDVSWTHLPYSISYEYAQGTDDTLTGAATAATGTSPTFARKAKGQYLTFAYTWGEQFLASEKSVAKYDDYWPKSYQAFVRLDSFDANTRATAVGDKTNIATLGLNAFFAETSKLQLNYLLARNDQPIAGYTANRPRKTRGIQLQLQYGF